MKLKSSGLWIYLIAVFILAHPVIAKSQTGIRYGVITDQDYLCDTRCIEVFLAEYWQGFALERDPTSQVFSKLEGQWYQGLDRVDVLIIPFSENYAPKSLTNLPIEALQRLKSFVEEGGIIVSQNSFENGNRSICNMSFIKATLGLSYEGSNWSYTPPLKLKYPGPEDQDLVCP